MSPHLTIVDDVVMAAQPIAAVGDQAACPHCPGTHELVAFDGSRSSGGLMIAYCGTRPYLAGIAGHYLPGRKEAL